MGVVCVSVLDSGWLLCDCVIVVLLFAFGVLLCLEWVY